jgi:tetraprenyl-beta-curcumene synthase
MPTTPAFEGGRRSVIFPINHDVEEIRLKRSGHYRAPSHPFTLMLRYYRYILPEVREQLRRWRAAAERIPNDEYRKQALASMTAKRFHCEGGAVYAAANLPMRHVLIPLIVAFQTISDYLDNLCDRSNSLDAADFRMLHRSMLDAADPHAELADYYAYRGGSDDGGYLGELVRTCQSCLARLPSYELVARDVRELVGLYCDLQVYKHVQPDRREPLLHEWWAAHRHRYPELYWNEFAAAAGSTLAVFTLFTAAADRDLAPCAIRRAYFPSICGLHILLDYLIDQEEDRLGGDLNFCSYYADDDETAERLERMADRARRDAAQLQEPRFHRMIVEGLLALYLTDPKVRAQQRVLKVARRLMRRSPLTRLFFGINSVWIRKALT